MSYTVPVHVLYQYSTTAVSTAGTMNGFLFNKSASSIHTMAIMVVLVRSLLL